MRVLLAMNLEGQRVPWCNLIAPQPYFYGSARVGQ